MKQTFWNDGTSQDVVRREDQNTSLVIKGSNYYNRGELSATATDTGNGFIVLFPSNSSTEQDYYVCLDYSQAYDLVLALSAFKKELGFV